MSLPLKSSLPWLVVLTLASMPFVAPAAPSVESGEVAIAQGFPSNRVIRLQIEISPASADSLRRSPRTYVRAIVREGTNVLENVALRLKGRSGSFRTIEDKPSFTLDVERFVPGRRFAGTSKVHLNNSVEDPSSLHDWLGSEIFRATGIPAPLVTHALVELNGRSLGLYVLKEGFAPAFLTRSFGRADGNLYEPEPGPGADVTGPMRRSSGSGAVDYPDLKRLAAVARTENLSERTHELAVVLDTDRFLTFLALEILLGHRDGYALARNNYRLYENPTDRRFVFLPGTMDNLLGKADEPLHPRMAGAVANALLEIPALRRAYREQLGLVFTNHFRPEVLAGTVTERGSLIARELPRTEAAALREHVAALARRIGERAGEVARLLAIPEPAPLRFNGDAALVEGWRAFGMPTDGTMEEVSIAGMGVLRIRAASKTASSWRTTVWLLPGRYRFEARVRTRAVMPLPLSRTSGVYLNVAGLSSASSVALIGDREWTRLETEFVLPTESQEVEVHCVLRAMSGEAWFERASLHLYRLSN